MLMDLCGKDPTARQLRSAIEGSKFDGVVDVDASSLRNMRDMANNKRGEVFLRDATLFSLLFGN